MNILITGGAGYIGYSLVHHLLRNTAVDTKLIIYDNLARGNYNFFFKGGNTDRVEFIRGELLDSRSLLKAVEQADMIYHLAARVTTPFADHDSHGFEQVNHWGTAGLVQAIEQHPVKRFIHLSSVSVYGRSEMPVNEESPTNPESFYGSSKARAEAHVQRLADKGVPTYIIRSGNVYGFNPCLRFDAVINRFCFDAHTRSRIFITGSGNQHRAFIHVDKLAHVLAAIATADVPPGTYNLAEHNLTVNDVADTLKSIYPGLERLYINQHLKMREIAVEVPVKLQQYLPLPQKSFEEEMKEFKAEFRV